jgi:hypothetical protein
MMRLNIEKKRRDHAHSFLSGDEAFFGESDQEGMETFQSLRSSKLRTSNVELPTVFFWIPRKRLWRMNVFLIDLDALKALVELGLDQMSNVFCKWSGTCDAEGSW